MRFDKASALYGEFGRFYVGYVTNIAAALEGPHTLASVVPRSRDGAAFRGSGVVSLMWNGLSSASAGGGVIRFWARRTSVRCCVLAEQSSGPRGQGGAPGAKRGRTTLTPGWRLLRLPGWPWCSGWVAAGEGVMCRAAGGLAASLMYACWVRRWALRSGVPHTPVGCRGCGHRLFGDRCCCGGCPAHHDEFSLLSSPDVAASRS